MWFGFVYMTLQLVPALSMLFLLTSAVGSALWSVHLEQEKMAQLPDDEEGLLPRAEYEDDP